MFEVLIQKIRNVHRCFFVLRRVIALKFRDRSRELYGRFGLASSPDGQHRAFAAVHSFPMVGCYEKCFGKNKNQKKRIFIDFKEVIKTANIF